MKLTAVGIGIILGLTWFIKSTISTNPGDVAGSQTGLVPDMDVAIFLTPTPTSSPTPAPSVTSSPSPEPTRIPTPTAIPVTGAQLDHWFEKYSDMYGIDRMRLFSIAACESMLKTNAINGIYAGLYQFDPAAWKNTRRKMNLDTDINLRFNPEEAIRTAAYKISVNGTSAWPNCGK